MAIWIHKKETNIFTKLKMLCYLCVGILFLIEKGIHAQTVHSVPDTASINVKLRVTESLVKKGEFRTAKNFALQAKKQSQLIGYQSGLGQAFLWESKILGHEGHYQEALKQIDSALSIAHRTADSSILSQAYRAYGNMYLFIGDDAKSLDFYFKGLAVEEKLKAQPNLHWFYNNIGNIYSHQRNYSKALENTMKGAEIAEKKMDKFALCRIYSNIAGVYHAIQKKDSALFYYNLSIKKAEEIGNKFDIANAVVNAGVLLIDLKQYELAKKYSIRSYDLSAKEGFTDIQIPSLHNLGNIAIESKDYALAEKYMEEALLLSKEISNKALIQTSYETLSILYRERGDYRKAFDYYQLFSAVKDSILNEGNSKLITEMNTKYTTEKKEKEIELLRKNEAIQKLELSKKENDLERQRTVSIAVFIGFILLMIVAILTYSRYRIKKKANDQLQNAYNLIEEKNKVIEKSNYLITDSITYAKRIQDAILPAEEELKKNLPGDFFILYKPAQIVSGDFYWCSSQEGKIIFVVADCTGHGVPGAFMSLIGNTLLNEIVNEQKITCTKEIARQLDKKIIHALHQDEGSEKFDGMDIGICCIDKPNREITFTGGRQHMYVYNGELKKIKGNPYSIGGALQQNVKLFASHIIPYENGLQLYLMTDGYCDQSGGELNKRFSSKRLEKLLTEIHSRNMEEQERTLENEFNAWKGDSKQRDDVLVVGIQC